MKEQKQQPLYDPAKEPILDVTGVKKLLPHRYPFLLVDKVIELTDDRVVGVKNVTANEPFFQGHFPEEPVMPGVLLIEACAQTGGMVVLANVEDPENYSTYFLKISNVKFRKKVVPGDTLILDLKMLGPLRRGIAEMQGIVWVGNSIVAEVFFLAQVVRNKA